MKAVSARVQLLVLVLILTAGLASSSSAASDIRVEKYTHVVELEPRNTFHSLDVLIALQEAVSEVTLAIPPRARELLVVVDDTQKDCSLTEKESHALLTCTFSPALEGKHSFSIDYATGYPLYDLKDRLLYKSEYKVLYPTEELVYILKLPPGAIIPEEKEVSFFVNPQPEQLYSDGRRIILRWERSQVNRDFDLSVVMQPVQQRLPWMRIAVLLALIIVVLFFVRNQRKGNGVKNGVKKEYTALLPDEQVVVDLLKKASGEGLWQKQLQLQSSFSKVKVSRILQRLEKRGVVRKEEWGNTNKVYLIDAKEHREHGEHQVSPGRKQEKPESPPETPPENVAAHKRHYADLEKDTEREEKPGAP